jgi:hypothetical protein
MEKCPCNVCGVCVEGKGSCENKQCRLAYSYANKLCDALLLISNDIALGIVTREQVVEWITNGFPHEWAPAYASRIIFESGKLPQL